MTSQRPFRRKTVALSRPQFYSDFNENSNLAFFTKNLVQVRNLAFDVKNFDQKWLTEICIFIENRRENRKS